MFDICSYSRCETSHHHQLPPNLLAMWPVTLTPKVAYSFKMLSALLDRLSQAAFEDISQRREFFLTSWKRRDKITRGVASLPFLIRTVLLIESPAERDALMQTSIIKNAMFCVESGNVSFDPRRHSCCLRPCTHLHPCCLQLLSLFFHVYFIKLVSGSLVCISQTQFSAPV